MTATINASTSGGGGIIQTADSSGILALQTGGTTAMTISASQLVGIGNASPSSRLDVRGSNNATNYRFGDSTGANALNIYNNTTSGVVDLGTSASAMAFSNAGVEKMRLDSSGNLGLAITPSAWYTNSSTVAQVRQAFFYAVENTTLEIGNNTYLTSGGSTWNYLNTGYATRYNQSSGKHLWYTAPSGTAGAAATFTQAMTLDASGTLQVGTTTSSGAITAASALTTTKQFAMRDSTNNYVRKMGVDSSNNWNFYDGDTEKMRLDSSGALLVGNTSNPGNGYRLLAATGGNFGLGVRTDNTIYMSALGTGTVYSNGGTLTNTNPSDERLKENITNVSWGLEQISALRPVSYTWKNNPTNQGTQYGFIAQEVQAVMPELVREFETRDGEEVVIRFGLEKDGIYAAMVKAIQEQQAIITTLTERISALEAK